MATYFYELYHSDTGMIEIKHRGGFDQQIENIKG